MILEEIGTTREDDERFKIEKAIVRLFESIGIRPKVDDIIDLSKILRRALTRQIKENAAIMVLDKIVLPKGSLDE